MADYLPKSTLKFLKDLHNNNNRVWFNEQKERYQTELQHFKDFVDALEKDVVKFDEIEKTKIFRIYRDVRFSKDKTPYKSVFSGSFTRAGKLRRGGFYFHIEPGNSFIGGGFWDPNKEDLYRIRKEIETDAKPMRKIINSAAFKKAFGSLSGEQLKTAPKGFDREHPNADLLRYKQFLLAQNYTDQEVTTPGFAKQVAKGFKNMLPFFTYMSEVLTTNLNGESIV